MDSLIACTPKDSIQRFHNRRPGVCNLDDATSVSVFLGEEQRTGKRVIGTAIDGIEISEASRSICRRQQRDLVLQVLYIEIDAGDICQIAGVFVSLKQEVMTVVEVLVRSAWALQEIHISILVRLGA